MNRAGWLGLALVAGCAEKVQIDLALPAVPPTTRSVFVALATETGVDLYAIDPRAQTGNPSPFIPDAPEAVSVFMLAYEAPLSEFLVDAPGRISLAKVEPFFSLPAAGSFQQAEIVGITPGQFRPVTALPARIRDMRLPGTPTHCKKYHQENVSIGAKISGAVAIDDDTALLITDDGPFFTISAKDGFEPHPLAVSQNIPRNLAHRDSKGTIWLFDNGGETAKYDPLTNTATRTETHGDLDEVLVIDDGLPDPNGRFWVMTMRERFDAFEDGRWLSHAHEPPIDPKREYARGIVELADGTIVTSSRIDTTVSLHAPDGTRRIATAPNTLGFSAGITVPSYGALLGGTDGRIYRFTPPQTFDQLPGGELGFLHSLPIYAMARRNRTLYLGSPMASFGIFDLDKGFCESERIGLVAIESIIPMGALDILVVLDGEMSVIWLSPE